MSEPANASSASEPTAPRTLGKYELLRLLARGGMGEVHLARLPGELGFEKLLVVKTIRADLAADPRFVELFAAEAKTAVGLNHPNIAPIYELGRAEDGTLYTAMGWVDGPSLQVLGERLRALGRTLELGAALFIAREILDGLAHAHTPDRDRPPVVHRDITPRNVLVDRSGRVQVVDFGIAKPAQSEARAIMRSAGYMAPEQARAEAVDPRADVFSVGCVLYELLTTERAFEREGVWMSPSFASVPAPLHELLERALALEPKRRFADADAFRRALAPILAEVAPVFGSRDLAAILRELFPDDEWAKAELDSAEADAGQTPATEIPGRVETFATRLRPRPTTEPDVITGALPAIPPELPGAVTVASATGERPAWRRRSTWIALAIIAIVAIVAVSAGLFGYALAPRDEPTSELKPPEPPPREAPSTGTEPNPPREPEPTQPPVAVAPTRIELLVEPPGASLTLDGTALDGPPWIVELDAKPRELAVTLDGHREMTVALDPTRPPTSPMSIVLTPLAHCDLSVVAPSVAWAEVWLDGAKIGTTPLTNKPVLEGRHKLEVRCTAAVCGDPRTLLERSVRIKPGRENKFSAAD